MKIFSPVKDYTGVSASVPFCNGVGETDDPYLIGWFKEHGYEVEEKTETDEQLDVLATEEPNKETRTKRAGK
jgi:hypothetical protein